MSSPISKAVVVGSTYKTKRNGQIEVIDYKSNINVTMRFLSTGYERTATVQNIVNGSVKDPLFRNIFGFGCIGLGVHSRKTNTKGYDVWFRMIERCYSRKAQLKPKNKSYIGVTVSDKWSCFQNFSSWYIENHKEGYELDKDSLQRGVKNKVYSDETCVFLTPLENSNESAARMYSFISPVGVNTKIYNLTKFCRENNLCQGSMSNVSLGKTLTHKGWVKYEDRS